MDQLTLEHISFIGLLLEAESDKLPLSLAAMGQSDRLQTWLDYMNEIYEPISLMAQSLTEEEKTTLPPCACPNCFYGDEEDED